MKKVGRPSLYTEALAERICEQLADGDSLRTICAREKMPDVSTVRRWLRDRPDFCAQYARAREEQADAFADEIVRIADSELDPNDKRVRVDARKWVASKLRPKRYGDRLELGGELKTGLTEAEIDARIAALLAAPGTGI